MFQKIRLDFWGVSAENFREQRNIRNGTPGLHVLNGDSYFIYSKLSLKPVWGLRERFLVYGFELRKSVVNAIPALNLPQVDVTSF